MFKSWRSLSPLKIGVSVTVLALFAAVSLSGCKQTDIDKVADAQECLDAYARNGGGDLTACETKVDGVTTPAAYGIRCATGYIREGFGSAQSFIDAFNAMTSVSASSVANFLQLITFDSAGYGNTTNVDANYYNAQRVYGYCAESLGKGATLLASFSFITNVLFKYECDNAPGSGFMGTCDMSSANGPTTLATAIGVAITDGSGSTNSMKGDLGTIVVNTYTASCSTSTSNQQLCKFLKTAIDNAGGTDNKTLVGDKFLNVLKNPPS